MFARSADSAFRRFRATGDPAALARVFDATAPDLLHLARHLASGEAAAEDLVQATFLTAIEARRDHDGARPVLPWLLGVLANHARAARRRSRRPLDAARLPGAAPEDPLAAAEGSELRDVLGRTIESLPAPYRPVLRLLLEHGLEPAEIATALGRAPGTVRAQVSRGLDALRRALPAGIAAGAAAATRAPAAPGRGLAAVRAAVLLRCAAPAESAAALSVSAFLLAMTTSKATLVAATLGAAASLVFFLWPDPPGAALPNAAGGEPPAPLRAEAPAAATPAAETPARVGLETPATAPDPAPEPDARVLEVVVRRALDRTPLAGATVRVLELARMQHLVGQGPPRTTDGEGLARFVDPPAGTVLVHVDRAGPVRAVEAPAAGVERVEVEVPAGISVEGSVVDSGGRPVPGATILAHGALIEPSAIAASDAAGRFALTDMQPGLALEATARGFGPSLVHPIRGGAGARVALTLELGAASRLVAGRVLQPDGAPAAGAVVAAFDPAAAPPTNDRPHPRPRFGRADGDGRFELSALAGVDLVVVACPAASEEHAPSRAAIAAGTAPASVDVVLRRAAEVSGTVVHGDEAKAGVHVTAWPHAPEEDFGALLNVIGLRAATVDAEGRFHLRGLLPGDYELAVHGAGAAAKDYRTLREGDRARWDVDLAAGRTLRVRVEPPTPTGATAVPVWTARVLRLSGDGGRELAGFQMCAPDGRVAFSGLAPGEYEVVIGVTGAAAGGRLDLAVAALGPLAPDTEEHAVAVAEARRPGAVLRGRLVGAGGAPRPNQVVRATGGLAAHPSWCTATTDQDGRFELGPLIAGDWAVGAGEHQGPTLAVVRALLPAESRDLGDVRAP